MSRTWTRAAGAVLMVAAGSGGGIAHAQVALPTPIDPAAINEENRRRQQQADQPLPAEAGPTVTVTPPMGGDGIPNSDARFRLTRVEFDTSTYLTPAALDALAAPYLGREVGFADLQALVAAVNAAYAAAGVATARAVLAPQRIEGGVLRIRLIEGKIGETRIEGGSDVGRALVGDRVALPQGSVADVRAIEQSLLRFNRQNDSQLRASVAPGRDFGQTDIVVALVEPKRFGFDLSADNNGYESTGRLQAGASLRAYRLLTGDDRLAASGSIAPGVRSGSLSYSVGVDDTTRLGFSYAHGFTRVVRGAFAPLDITGTSDTAAVNASALMVSNANHTLITAVSGQYTRSRTKISDVRVGDGVVIAADATVTYSYADGSGSVAVTQGVTIADVDERLQRIGSSVVLARGSLFAARGIGRDVRLRVRADWQLTGDDDLNGVLQYQAGGTRSSRAFAPGTVGGDRGFATAVELGYMFNASGYYVEPFVFLEQATVDSRLPVSYLGSGGAGLNVELADRASLNLYVARRLTTPLPQLDDWRAAGSFLVRF